MFCHNHPCVHLYAVKRWVEVVTEGASEHFFVEELSAEPNETPVEQNGGAGEEISENVLHAGNRSKDIMMVRAQGLNVDDDNEPLPENIPETTTSDSSDSNANPEHETVGWGWSEIDHRRQINIKNVCAAIAAIMNDAMQHISYLSMAFLLFPNSYIELIIEEANKKLDEPVSMGEFLRWIRIWLFLSTMLGFKRIEFWSLKEVDLEVGAPYRPNEYMSSNRFESILSALTLKKQKPPTSKDRFWQVKELIEAWNDHMLQSFVPSWASCLDKSMSIWFNRFTCPGWIFCPRKPHPFGNEYHSICCANSGIMYAVELLEGKDTPKEAPKDPNDPRIGKTGSLLLRLTRSLYSTGKVVILDSSFCVLRAIIELRKKGVFASALIKKRKYWPKYIPGKDINTRMQNKTVGECDSLAGTLDSVPYDVFCLKEPDYSTKIMSTYGGLVEPPNQPESKRIFKNRSGETVTITFKYVEPFANHFNFRHAVDDHNSLRHGLPGIEPSIVTDSWPIRVFSFFLAITEVNVFKAFKYFVWTDGNSPESLLKFRKKLALAFIHKEELQREAPRNKRFSRKREDWTIVWSQRRHIQVDLLVADGKTNLRPSTNNLYVEVVDVKNKCKPIAVVLLAIVCAKSVIWNI